MNLSLRLSTISTLVPFGARVCDVGTDHGYLPVFLKSQGSVQHIIATDIGEKPLENARKNIQQSGVDGIELRLCDGLSGIEKNEVDTIIIAGMGGEVISGILNRRQDIAKDFNITLILQPTTSPEYLREFLIKEGFLISKEIPVFENGKIYSVMLVKFHQKVETKPYFYYYVGEVKPDTEFGLIYIKKQQDRCYKCMKSLESVTKKHEKFLFYSKIYNDITNYLNTTVLEN